MYVVKDLVPDMNNFYDQYKSVQPWLQLKETTEHTYAERQDGLKVFNETYQVPNRIDKPFLLALIPSTRAEMPAAGVEPEGEVMVAGAGERYGGVSPCLNGINKPIKTNHL